MALSERPSAAQHHGADVVVGVPDHVDEAEVERRHRAAQSLEEGAISVETLHRTAGVAVADDAKLAMATLPLAGDRVAVDAAGAPALAPLAPMLIPCDLQTEGEDAVAAEPVGDVAQGVELVGERDLRMGIEERADDAVARSRMAEEDHEAARATEVGRSAGARRGTRPPSARRCGAASS